MKDMIANHKQMKPGFMEELKLKQIRYEIETWKRLVCFITEENIYLKNRLSDVLKDPFNYSLLEQLECFQTRFINADNLMDFLRHEFAQIEQLLTVIPKDNGILINMHTKLITLRNGVRYAEREFIKLKLEFNSYLSNNI